MASSSDKLDFSAALKRNLKGRQERPGNESNEENNLFGKILKLKDDIPNGDAFENLRKSIEDIAKEASRILRQTEKEGEDYRNEIRQLNVRVRDLEEELARLRTIDMAEAVKLMENHVATFVLPPGQKIAEIDAITQMIEYTQCHENEPERKWKTLLSLCGMADWTKTHEDCRLKWIMYRNADAHKKKFDLAKLKEDMPNKMDHRSKESEDIVNLLQKVDSLMKLGKLLSEFLTRYADSTKRIRSASKKRWVRTFVANCYRDVENLQDIPTKDAKAHLDKYIPQGEIDLLNSLLGEMESINGARLGELVRDSEFQVVSGILQDPAILTFDDMVAFLSTSKRATLRDAHQRWGTLTKGITWSKEHGDAMKILRKLVPASGQSQRVYDLPIVIARLLIPDFLEKYLWEAGSDILDILAKWFEGKRQ